MGVRRKVVAHVVFIEKEKLMKKLEFYLNTKVEDLRLKSFHSSFQLNKQGDQICFSGDQSAYSVYFKPGGSKNMTFVCRIEDGEITEVDKKTAEFVFGSDLVEN